MGFGLVAFSLALFAYYTLWIVVLVRGGGGGEGSGGAGGGGTVRRNRPGGVPGVGATHGAGGIAPGVGAPLTAAPGLVVRAPVPQSAPNCLKLPQIAPKCPKMQQ